MKGLFWFGIVLLVLVMVFSGFSASCYAPPRDENTVPPYVEDFDSNVAQASQTEVFKDASGWLNQREHPLTDFFQANAFSGTDMGTFSSLESSAGTAEMTVIPYDEQYSYGGAISQTVAGTTKCLKSVAVIRPKDKDVNTYICPGYTPGSVIDAVPVLTGGSVGNVSYTVDGQTYTFAATWNKPVTTGAFVPVYFKPEAKSNGSLMPSETGECVLGPGTYTIDETSYLMDVYPPLYVKATGPNGVVENLSYGGDECKPPQRLTLDPRRGLNTLILSLTDLNPRTEKLSSYNGY
jgi:hypothetical protein